MQRHLTQLTERPYDVLVVGAGIYGVYTAWDAAMRGLSVALVEKADFGHATSFNSLKVIHGGLRYLQHLDIRRMRTSIHTRRVQMRTAPHLVHPLPFLMPTHGHGLKSKEIMAVALALNDLIGYDRNRLADEDHVLPRGRVLSATACRQRIPGLQGNDLTGAALWYDAQMYSSERLLLAALHSAVQAGAEVANYVEVTAYLRQGARISGVTATDTLTGDTFDIRARIVVNTGGPWVNDLFARSQGGPASPRVHLSKAMNLVVNRVLIPEYAVGIASRQQYRDSRAVVHKGTRLFFIVPWQQYSLIGTTHVPFHGAPQDLAVTEEEVEDFIAEINASYPAANLKGEDIRWVYAGLLPMNAPRRAAEDVSLSKRFWIVDHAQDHQVEGLLSVVGVKYTEARYVAMKTVDLVGQKLGRPLRPCQTAITPVYGGDIEQFHTFQQQAIAGRPEALTEEALRRLTHAHGTAYPNIVRYTASEPSLGDPIVAGLPVLKAEVLYAVREEMALTLADVILRRTEAALHGACDEAALRACVTLMAPELGWDGPTQQREIAATRALCSTSGGLLHPSRRHGTTHEE